MSVASISVVVFGCVFGGALLGIFLRAVLPQHHLSADSKDIVKLGMGLVGTMSALVLGLLVASAKGFYDTQSGEVTQLSANMALLDRVLAHYGPETKAARELLRTTATNTLEQMWSAEPPGGRPTPSATGAEVLYSRIQALNPQNGAQHALQAQASGIAMDLGRTRWLMHAQSAAAVSKPLLVLLVLWLSVIFVSFGLFAPANATVVSSLFVSALSVSGAVFLILEMYSPYTGMIQVPDAALRAVVAQLGK